MRKIIIVAGVVLAIVGVCLMVEADETELRLGTFNVRVPVDSGANEIDKRIPRIVEIVRAEGMEIVGLEENNGHDAKLKKLLPEYDFAAAGRDEKGQGEGMALMWLRDRFELVSKEVLWLSKTPNVKGSRSWGSACPRIALIGRFRDRDNDNRFSCIVTHLDHISSEAREGQMGMVLDLAAEEAKEGPVFVVGDMNDTEESKPILLAKEYMSDAKEVSETDHRGPNETFNGYDKPKSCIDYIFVSDDVKVLSHATIDTKPGGKFASDHFPVIADLKFGSPASPSEPNGEQPESED